MSSTYHLRVVPPPRFPDPPTVLHVDASRLVAGLVVGCLAVEGGLVAADALINYAHGSEIGSVRRFFNITREDGVATWFAVTQTWMAALTLGLIAWTAQGRRRAGWGVLALFFGYMALDDGSKLHERLGTAFKESVGEAALAAFPSYTWQLLFAPVFAAMGLFMAAFLWRAIQTPRERVMVGAALGVLAFAVGLDFIEGMDPEHPLNLHTVIQQSWALTTYDVSHFAKSLEEFLEMFANTLLWAVFVLQLARSAPDLRFRFTLRE